MLDHWMYSGSLSPTFPKPSLTISSPVTPLEIRILGKLSAQGSGPSAVLHLCSKHTRAAFHFLEDRLIPHLAAKTPEVCQVQYFLPRYPPFSPAPH